MTIKALFLVGVVASALTEWVKKLLPTSFVEKKFTCPILAALISAICGVCYGLILGLTWSSIAIGAVIVVAMSQTCYSLLFKTAKAIYERLMLKVVEVDTDKIAEEVADEVIDKAKEAVEGAASKK